MDRSARLLVVSNRLPITIVEKEGKLRIKESVGGLVSGLSAYLDPLRGSPFTKSEYIWVGWPGIAVDDKTKEELKLKAMAEFHAYPVFISEKDMERFYHGFCNKTIWPLFHYFPSYAIYEEDYWLHYKKVNEAFCDAIMEIIKPDDVVWIHDYHLMLLPGLCNHKNAADKITQFLGFSPEFSLGFFIQNMLKGALHLFSWF